MLFMVFIPLFSFFISIFFGIFVIFFTIDGLSLKAFYRTAWRDLWAAFCFIKITVFGVYCRFRNLTVVDFFNENAKRNSENVCFYFEDEEWTYKQVDEFSNKIAHCFLREGFRKGDEIALLMGNCPDYICIWLGLAKIGVTTALINTNQKTNTLAHSLNIINLKGFIFDCNFAENVENAIPFIDKMNSSTFYSYSRKLKQNMNFPFYCENLNVLMDEIVGLALDPKEFKTDFLGNLFYIYTSGTTGLPKAAVIKHRRFIMAAAASKYVMEVLETHTFYHTLPQYHMLGSFMNSFLLSFGGKMVVNRKFSASNFWKDVVKYKATNCMYIGEICRYLLNQPKVPEETQHSMQLMIGNGLKPHIWKEFQDRFKVKKIIEMYGSTEGNITLVNFEGKAGAIGFICKLFAKMQGVYPIRIHPETGEFLRNSEGICIRCKPGESGELVGKVSNFNHIKAFDGYIDTSETNKKIIRDCFKKGDMAFTSGDIVVMDEDGYLYFKDRCGDTYRWKGENVSTTEVENIVSKILNLATCVVYGVKIPNCEGRIGMVAVQVDDPKLIDFEKFYRDIAEKLPTYAIPAFIRFSNHIETTGTHKPIKTKLKEQGYNIEDIRDPLYALDTNKKTYIPLTREIYNDITNGKINF